MTKTEAVIMMKARGVATALGLLTGREPIVEYKRDANGLYASLSWAEADRAALQQQIGPMLDSAARGVTAPGKPSAIRVDWGAVVGPVVAKRTIPAAGLIAAGLFGVGYLLGRGAGR